MGLSLQEKFEARVQCVPFSSCHYWTGEANADGYGLLNKRRATHISLNLIGVDVPKVIDGDRAVVRHKCDTPLCVNPDHLELGTQAQNMNDMKVRGRASQGENHVFAKLNGVKAEQIVSAIESGERVVDVAARYGISPSRVSMIRYGQSNWCEVKKPTGRSDRRISDEAAVSIYEAAHNGESRGAIAKRFGVTPTMVSDIKRGATYASVTGHRR